MFRMATALTQPDTLPDRTMTTACFNAIVRTSQDRRPRVSFAPSIPPTLTQRGN